MKWSGLRRLLLFCRREPQPVVPPGLHHFVRETDGQPTRFHLRVEPDGSGTLLANSTAAARLTSSGVVIVLGVLRGDPHEAIVEQVLRHFHRVSRAQVTEDLQSVCALVDELAAPGDNYPIVNLEDAAVSPRQARLIAPWRADAPLGDGSHLDSIIDRMWEAGIPHVVFLAPEGLAHSKLVRAVEHAEDVGLLAGVRGRASDLNDPPLLSALAQAGIDHVNIMLHSPDPETHDALCGEGDHGAAMEMWDRLHELEVCPVAEVALVESTADSVPETVETLVECDVANVSFYAIVAPDEMELAEDDLALRSSAMPAVAALVEETAVEVGVRMLWQPPVRRDPEVLFSDQVVDGPRCSGDAAVRIASDGSVIPPRGPYQSAGNILEQPWEEIWSHDAFRRYRERVEAPTRCDECPGLAICAADCPADPEGWSY